MPATLFIRQIERKERSISKRRLKHLHWISEIFSEFDVAKGETDESCSAAAHQILLQELSPSTNLSTPSRKPGARKDKSSIEIHYTSVIYYHFSRIPASGE